MSGICAVCRLGNPGALNGTLADMLGGLSANNAERVLKISQASVGVGVTARFASQQIYQNERVLIACDAELYNENSLAATFARGEASTEGSATASLLGAMYEKTGLDFVEKLRGGFSIILWDRVERQLIAAVDGFGIKRLVYHEGSGFLLVASRIDGLMQSGNIVREINVQAIPNILNFSANLGPGTIFRNVQRLGPGTLLIAAEGEKARFRTYWEMHYGMGIDSDEERLSRELEAVVEESVSAHAKIGEPSEVGAFLSGGTDSSTVVGMMARMARGPVKAFSIGFEEQSFNELEYAEMAARKYQAEHHKYLVGARDCLEALPQIVRSFDEPFGNSSAIPAYFCSRLAAQHGVKALLAGDGGDELFAGNEWYATDKVFEQYQRIPGFVRNVMIEPALAVLRMDRGLVGRARGYVRRAKMPPVQRILSFQFLFTHSPVDIFQQEFLDAVGDYSVGEIPTRHYERASARDHLDRLLSMDMKITIADSDLPKVTCMAELAGIQVRFPFLDRSVAEFSGRVPARLKVKGTQKRYLFKRAFRDLLPAEILNKKKHGFGIPVATWLKSDRRMRELARDTLLCSRSFERGYFRRTFIEDLFHRHEMDDSSYYGDTLWTFLFLELWHREYLDAAPLRRSA